MTPNFGGVFYDEKVILYANIYGKCANYISFTKGNSIPGVDWLMLMASQPV